MVGFLRLIGKVSRGEDIAVHKRDGRRTLGGKPVRHIGQVHKSATPSISAAVGNVSFVTSAVDPANAASYTFTGQSFGTVSADRILVVIVHATGNTTATTTGVTAAGNAMTLVSQGGTDARATNLDTDVSIWQIADSTNATGNVVVTCSGDKSRCGIGIFALTGISSAATDTAVSTASPPSSTLNVPANGVALGGAYSSGAASFTSTGLTERYDQDQEASNIQTGASDNFSTAQTGMTVTFTPTVNTVQAGAWAAWGP